MSKKLINNISNITNIPKKPKQKFLINNISDITNTNIVNKRSKKKTVALLLAIFFSFFTWIYTWKWDQNKFMIGFIGSIASIFLLVNFQSIIFIGIWIWAIVDVARKSDEMFEKYV